MNSESANAERRKAYLRAMGLTLLRPRSSSAADQSTTSSARQKKLGQAYVVQPSTDRSLKQNLSRRQKTAAMPPQTSRLQAPDRIIISETAEALIIDLPLPNWRKVEPKNYRQLLANLLHAIGLANTEPSVSFKLWPAPKTPDEKPANFFHSLLHEKLKEGKERRTLLVLSQELARYITGFEAAPKIKVFTAASAAKTLQEPLTKKLLWQDLKAQLKTKTGPTS